MNYKKIVYFTAVSAFAIFSIFAPSVSEAQVVNPLLTCAPISSVLIPAQEITFRATGGTGSYTWNAPGMTPQTGSELKVYYPWSGSSSVTVTSGGQTATCVVTITGNTFPTPALSCGIASRTVNPTEVTTFNATGGDGNYVWTAIGMTPRTGSSLSVYYAASGNSSMTVASAGLTATCLVNITGSVVGSTAPIVTPGLPNTGAGGASSTLFLNLGMVLALAGITTLFVERKRMSQSK